jgi:protein tyrosine phosphatase (PTP) superfamily phosphohydrolase (DUF442 family)
VAGAADLTAEKAQELAAALEGDGPALVHCASSNRVGALLALRAFYVAGASPSDALETGRRAGLSGLEEDVKQRLAAPRAAEP